MAGIYIIYATPITIKLEKNVAFLSVSALSWNMGEFLCAIRGKNSINHLYTGLLSAST
jgi:predicted transposase YbfD/YdcC